MFVKSRSDWYSLDWSGADLYRYCYQWMEKVSPCLCSHRGQHFMQFYYSQLKNGQMD